MKHLYSVAVCLTLTAGAAVAGVSTNLLNLVMPDATVVSGINVDQSVNSPFGQYIMSQMQFNDAEFQQLLSATGFDPRRDLHEILAATPATSTSSAHSGLILGRGVFNPSMVISTATSQGAILSVYKGFTLLGPPPTTSPNQPPVALALTFLDQATVAMGDAASVKGAIDRKLSAAVFAGPLAASALQASAANSAWFATTTPLSDFMSARPSTNLGPVAQSGLMQSILAASGGVQFGTTALTLTADCVTANPQNAQALVDVLKFFVSMIAGNANAPSGAASIASSAQFTVNGSTAHISLQLPEAQVEQLLMPKVNGAHRRAAAVR